MEWIKGYENKYKITKDGKIFSFYKNGKIKELNLPYHKQGYQRIELCNNNKKTKHLVHRLVAQTFISNPENKKEVNHINGVKDDNRVENLEWCTASENQIHAINNNLREIIKGENHYKTKFTNEDIINIRNDNRLYKFIAQDYNVDKTTIGYIKTYKTWKHI